MDTKFYPGQRVRCIHGQRSSLIEGEVYTVDHYESGFGRDFVHLTGVSGGWVEERFEAVSDEPPISRVNWQVGDIVRCVNPGCTPAKRGELYEIITNRDGDPEVYLPSLEHITQTWAGDSGEWTLVQRPFGVQEEEDAEFTIEELIAQFIESDPELVEEDGWVSSYASPPTEDIVIRPNHYTQYEIEPITFIMRNGFDFWRGNIIKYASRAGSKLYDGQDARQSEITDLRKVIRYSEMRINQLQGEETL